MARNEQEKPLASENHRIAINDNDNNNNASSTKRKRNSNRCLWCCSCTTTVFVLLGVIILVLMLTVFKVKDPKITLNYVSIKGLEGINPLNLVPNTNLTIIANLSIKNPNVAAFKFRNASTGIYYENILIGVAQTPQGIAKARRTFEMKVSIDFMLETLLRVPRIIVDLTAGELPLSSQTNIKGRVEIINIIKKTVGVKLDCSLTVIISNETLKDRKCKRYVSI